MRPILAWLIANGPVYRDNPTARRDFRSQLRGNKALLLWSAYLLILMSLSMLVYHGIANDRVLSVADIQNQLRMFYLTTLQILAGGICLITPALTAGAIVVEKQRKSLDLLFSAPVSYKSLLVGKMLSSYRYTWMLLALSIPVTAVAVVMGGATWSDVLSAYAMLSFSALVLTAIGLLISALAESVGAAIIWTYLAVILYLLASGGLAAGISVPSVGLGSETLVIPWYVGISPFAVDYAAPGSSSIFGHAAPNWALVGLYSLLVTRLLILGAASTLSPFGSKETKSFRIQLPIYFFALMALVRVVLGSFYASPLLDGIIVMAGACLLLPFLPNLVSYGPDGGRKFGASRHFDWGSTLTGARAGTLPYLLILLTALVCGVFVGAVYSPSTPTFAGMSGSFGGVMPVFGLAEHVAAIGSAAGWALGFLLFFWTFGRFVSSRSKSLKSSRLALLGLSILFLGIPVPVITIIEMQMNPFGGIGSVRSLWEPYPFYPFFALDNLPYAPLYGLVFVALGLYFLRLELRSLRRGPTEVAA